jgi:hypothetical protein
VATAAQRAHVGAVLGWLQAHAGQLDYPWRDNRDSRDSTSWHLSEQQAEHLLAAGGRMQLDCSELGAWVLRCAGLWHWSDPGWTGSHLQLLTQHYENPRIARTGALVVFGPGDGDHECVVWHPDAEGGDPILAGHGRPGFDVERLSVVRLRHRAPVRFLSIAHL